MEERKGFVAAEKDNFTITTDLPYLMLNIPTHLLIYKYTVYLSFNSTHRIRTG